MGGLATGRADQDIDHITGYSLWGTSYEWLHSRDLLFLLAASWLPTYGFKMVLAAVQPHTLTTLSMVESALLY